MVSEVRNNKHTRKSKNNESNRQKKEGNGRRSKMPIYFDYRRSNWLLDLRIGRFLFSAGAEQYSPNGNPQTFFRTESLSGTLKNRQIIIFITAHEHHISISKNFSFFPRHSNREIRSRKINRIFNPIKIETLTANFENRTRSIYR